MDPKTSPKNHQRSIERLQIIAPLVHRTSRSRELLEQIAADNQVSVRTLKRWIKAYENNKLDGLTPNYQGSKSRLRLYQGFDDLVARACDMRRQDPRISVNNIIFALESENPGLPLREIVKRSTLQRALEKNHCSRRELITGARMAGRRAYGRYIKEHSLELVQTDVKEFSGCQIYDEHGARVKLYVCLFLDSHSRMILSYKTATDQKQHISMDPMRQMVETFGLPKTILTDNGSIYRSKVMNRACACLGIRLSFCAVRQPEGKGAVERMNGILNELETQFKALGRAPLDVYVTCIEEWVARHNSSPSALLGGRSPEQAFHVACRAPAFAGQEVLEEAFKRSEVRKVAKDGTVSLGGVDYQIPHPLVRVGSKVELLISEAGARRKVELVTDNGTVIIEPLKPLPDVERAALTRASPVTPELKNAALPLAYLRNRKRRENQYTTEEEFMQEMQDKFDKLPPENADTEADAPNARSGPETRDPAPRTRGPEPASPYLTMQQKQQEKDQNGR